MQNSSTFAYNKNIVKYIQIMPEFTRSFKNDVANFNGAEHLILGFLICLLNINNHHYGIFTQFQPWLFDFINEQTPLDFSNPGWNVLFREHFI